MSTPRTSFAVHLTPGGTGLIDLSDVRTEEVTFRVVIPITPPSILFPNAARRTDYHAKADASRPLRELAYWTAMEAALPIRSINGGPIFAGQVKVRVLVLWEKGRRMPDVSGLGLAVKALEDGLTDAAIWTDDSRIVEACYRQGRDPDGKGAVVFEIEEAMNGG